MADSAKFCAVCGSALEAGPENNGGNRKKNEKRKKALLAGLACLCIGAACLTGAWFVRADNNPEKYAEAIGYAEKYLIDQDYGRAEEYYLEAKKIDPKQPEPYEGLYEIYVATDQNEKAEEIEKEAHENLEQESQDAFDERTEEIDEEYTYVNSYEIIRELGDLEMTPISVRDEIWLVKRDGEFFFMDTQGDEVSLFPTERSYFMVMAPNELNNYNREFFACLPTDYETVDKNQWPNKDIVGNQCGGRGGTAFAYAEFYLDEDNRPALTENSIDSFREFGDGSVSVEVSEPYFLRRKNQRDGKYFVYNPALDLVTGPYLEDETAGFSQHVTNIPNLSMDISEVYHMDTFLLSPFWAREPESDLITLYTQDGTKSLSGFDRALTTDWSSIGAYQKDLFYLLNEYLITDYTGYFEAGAKSINHTAPVKIDGSWKLVRLGDPVRNKDLDAALKEIEENAFLPLEIVGDYSYFSGVGGWSSGLDLRRDGSFKFSYFNQDGGGRYVYSCSAAGKLEPVFDDQGKLKSFTVLEIKDDKEPGTVKHDNGMEVTTEEAKDFGLVPGTEILYYPSDTPIEDMNERAQDRMAVLEGAGLQKDGCPYLFIVPDGGLYIRTSY